MLATAAPGNTGAGKTGRIKNADAKQAALPERLREKAEQRKADPSRLVGVLRGRPEPALLQMPAADAARRAQSTGTRLSSLGRQAASLQRGRGAAVGRSYAALRMLRALLGDEDEDEDQDSAGRRIAATVLVDEKFRDPEQLAKHLRDTETPEELAELLKDVLKDAPPDSKPLDIQTLCQKIKRSDTSTIMGWLADMQGIPRLLKGQERQALRESVENQIRQLESSNAAADAHEVATLWLADVAKGQPNQPEFVATCVEVANKAPSNWIELTRSIVRNCPSGLATPGAFEATLHNLIGALGVEMWTVIKSFTKEHLAAVNFQLQRAYEGRSLVDGLFRVNDEVAPSMRAITA
ncbi:hypothetical protein GCM10023165_34130 [Variovorax defluvii]|uniref:Uncharacterized protein n=1 Tax=Variovorax defluvii TaxID=913761 RepID=A0ABP8HZT3_9BURK